jgi:hypothetical protein
MEISDVLNYLDNRKDYSIVGDVAFMIYLDRLKTFSEINIISNSDLDFDGCIRENSPFDSLFDKSVVRDSVEKVVEGHTVRVAKPEQLIAMDLSFGKKQGFRSFELMERLRKNLDYEEIRCLWKRLDNYDELYSTLIQAYYEFTR